MTAKKYYWIKLQRDFFEQKEIKLLRKIAGGDTYTIIYLKMILASLEYEGLLLFEGIADNIHEEVALLIDEDVENVQVTMTYLIKKGLLELKEADEYFLTQALVMTGSESSSASRVRRHREKKKESEMLQCNVDGLHCNSGVTKCNDIKSKSKSKSKSNMQLQGQEGVVKQALEFYQNNFGVLSPYIQEDLIDWCQDYPLDLVIEAMKRALTNQKPYSYAQGILKSWIGKNIRTLEQAKAEAIQHKQQQRNGNQQPVYHVEDYRKELYGE